MLLRRRDDIAVGQILPDAFLLGGERVDVENKKLMTDRFSGATVLLEPEIGGLSEDGSLGDHAPLTTGEDANQEPYERWGKMHVEPNLLIRRVPGSTASEGAPAHRNVLAIPDAFRKWDPAIETKAARDEQLRGCRRVWRTRLRPTSEDEDTEPDVVEYWSLRWDIDGETAAAKRDQLLNEHHDWAASELGRVAQRLTLSEQLIRCLVLAISLHDHGKGRLAWRRAAGAPLIGEPLAKTAKRRMGDLAGYRHEFGSLRDALDPQRYGNRLEVLDERFRELALHLIAAHHGRPRPFIPPIDEDEKDVFGAILPETAFEAAQRYVKLQRDWGPWGLAWLDALLRAADAAVSRKLDNPEPSVAEAAE